MKRKPLFYAINLIAPCLNISILAVLVFLLPSDSRQKITLSVSILVTLLVFYLLLIDLIPATSIVIPLLGKYLLFTLVLVNLSIGTTIFTINIHFCRNSPSKVFGRTRNVLLNMLSKLVFMERPPMRVYQIEFESLARRRSEASSNFVKETFENIAYIVDQMKRMQEEKEMIEEWRFIALIFDRMFLIIFISISLIGTVSLFLTVPSLYNSNAPIDPICYLYYPPTNDSSWSRRCFEQR